MTEIRDFMYDEVGLCPRCGLPMAAIPYYREKTEAGLSVMRLTT